MPSGKKRPMDRKQAKEKLRSGGDRGPYKEVLQNLILEKEKLKEEIKESKIIHEHKVSVEEHKMETKKRKADIEKQRLRWD